METDFHMLHEKMFQNNLYSFSMKDLITHVLLETVKVPYVIYGYRF